MSKMDNRHAYLIMAHDNPGQLSKLIRLLDDERNDIFVHIDKKSESFPMEMFDSLVRKSTLKVITRKECFWAGYSQVDIELDLLATATQQGHYRYYHLLSGHDLPLKTQNQIHAFFDCHDEEFITFNGGGGRYHAKYTKYRHLFLEINTFRTSKLLKILDEFFVQIQALFNVDSQKKRNDKNWQFCDGWQWFSITDDFAKYILSQREYIQRIFKDTKASDEFLMATLAYNSQYYERIYQRKNETGYGSMRFINFVSGKPYIFRNSDFNKLMSSSCIFARKFDETVDKEIIEKIYLSLKGN